MSQRALFSLLAEIDRREAWRGSGARDTAHWLWMRYGISDWKARRWVAAAHALSDLPEVSQAFMSGELGIDKVVELTRIATTENEGDLARWARGVSCGAIRRRGDIAARVDIAEAVEADRARTLSWWYFDEGRRFGLEAEMPASQGAKVARALGRLAETLPVMPGEEDASYASTRRADALTALCSVQIADDADQDRATIVVHVKAAEGDSGAAEVEDAPPIHNETLRRLMCNARVQTVVEDQIGTVVELGKLTREPPAWMLRQVRYRDKECRFPGCGTRRFTQAHHIVYWRDGGDTVLENLLLICSFHHKLVHEYGWSVERDAGGLINWFRPDGSGYRSGPSPPEKTV